MHLICSLTRWLVKKNLMTQFPIPILVFGWNLLTFQEQINTNFHRNSKTTQLRTPIKLNLEQILSHKKLKLNIISNQILNCIHLVPKVSNLSKTQTQTQKEICTHIGPNWVAQPWREKKKCNTWDELAKDGRREWWCVRGWGFANSGSGCHLVGNATISGGGRQRRGLDHLLSCEFQFQNSTRDGDIYIFW